MGPVQLRLLMRPHPGAGSASRQILKQTLDHRTLVWAVSLQNLTLVDPGRFCRGRHGISDLHHQRDCLVDARRYPPS
jgi:hypothetical protein